MGRIIACANQKGGVGKTTTVINVGTYLALDGHRVLIVDLDPQGNATSGLGVDRQSLRGSAYDGVVEGVGLADLAVDTAVDGLGLVPSSISLAGAELELAGMERRERRLANLVAAVADDYDVILIDCPPSLGLLTINALTAADGVLIPLQVEFYALEGLTQLMGTIVLVREHLHPDLDIDGVVLTMHDGRTRLSSDVAHEARRHLGAHVFDAIVPRSVRLSEAPSHGLPIARYAPTSRGAEAYQAVARELRQRVLAGPDDVSGGRAADTRAPHDARGGGAGNRSHAFAEAQA